MKQFKICFLDRIYLTDTYTVGDLIECLGRFLLCQTEWTDVPTRGWWIQPEQINADLINNVSNSIAGKTQLLKEMDEKKKKILEDLGYNQAMREN